MCGKDNSKFEIQLITSRLKLNIFKVTCKLTVKKAFYFLFYLSAESNFFNIANRSKSQLLVILDSLILVFPKGSLDTDNLLAGDPKKYSRLTNYQARDLFYGLLIIYLLGTFF